MESTSQTYSFFEEHSKEDIELVRRLQDEEQQRRIADKVGENQRRDNANHASDLFSLNVRPTWFQKGSAYTLKLILVARDAGNNVLRSSQVKSINSKVNEKMQIVGQKSAAKAQEVKNKAVETKDDVKVVLQERLADAQDAAGKVATKLRGVGLQDAQDAAGKVATKLRGVGLQIFNTLNKAISNLNSNNTNLAFAVLEEENERSYRMNSELEVYAMMNAFSVASLFKELAPAFYRPAWEPTSLYKTKLLEDKERVRRVLSDLSVKDGLNNANTVAKLVEHKLAATTPSDAALIAAKAEVVEEIREHTINPGTAIPEAKAAFVEEIKVHKPIPATM